MARVFSPPGKDINFASNAELSGDGGAVDRSGPSVSLAASLQDNTYSAGAEGSLFRVLHCIIHVVFLWKKVYISQAGWA